VAELACAAASTRVLDTRGFRVLGQKSSPGHQVNQFERRGSASNWRGAEPRVLAA